ncbi:MAG: FtsK/SpoIIIE domain-containing protein [Microthrixaceae bacterium]
MSGQSGGDPAADPGRNVRSEQLELWLHREGRAPLPLRVGHHTGTTVGEVAEALGRYVIDRLPPGTDPDSHGLPNPPGAPLTLEPLDPPSPAMAPDQPLMSAGPRRGAIVALRVATAPSGPLRLRPRTTVLVRRGADRGASVPLGEGVVVGRSPQAQLTLTDPAVSRRHLRLTRRETVVELHPLGRAPVTVGGRPLSGPLPLEPGIPVRLGDSELVVVAPQRQQPGPPRAHQRPPRAPWQAQPPPLEVPEPPRRTGAGTIPWLSIALTAAFAVVMVAGGGFGSGLAGTLIWFFTPLLLASGATEYAWSARRGDRKAREAWRRELRLACDRLEQRLDAEARRRSHDLPPTIDWVMAARMGSPRLWERRREHPDVLALRLGLSEGLAEVAGELPGSGPPELLAEAAEATTRARTRRDLVTALDLGQVGSVGLHGPQAHQLAASLVAQLVGAVGPEDVALAVLVAPEHAGRWAWSAALPHLRSASELLDHPASAGATGHRELAAALDRWAQTVSPPADSTAALPNQPGSAAGPPGSGRPRLVAVVDGALAAEHCGTAFPQRDGTKIELRRLASLCHHAARGIHVIWLGSAPSNTPLGCRATITASCPGAATAVGSPGEQPVTVRWRPVGAQRLDDLARHLAPRRDGDRAGSSTSLPGAVSLASLATPIEAGRRAIEPKGTLGTTVALGADGPVTIDLRRDGPHALVAGTTGAGKSELLRTLVAALALSHSPRRLNFVFVDFKGGTGMGPLARLPHVAGMITDLDVTEAERLRLGLEAEVERRLRLLAEAGVENLSALERHSPHAPPAIVLIIDEFAALARQAPAILEGIVDLAQRGRSLGLHLVLATQRPRGVISDAVRANTNLRLVARMADAEESIDVLDDPAAAQLPVGRPGRVLMRVGAAPPVPLQVAYTGAPIGMRPPVRITPLTLDQPGGEAAPVVAGPGDTEADAVVRRTLAAAGASGGATRLWLRPLPTQLTDPGPAPKQGWWPLACADLPRRRRRAVWALDPAGGVLVVLGGGGSGRTSTLRALGAAAAAGGAAVVGIDGAGGQLSALDGAVLWPDQGATVGAVAAVGDTERLARLIWWLESGGGDTRRVVLVDGWEGVWDRAEQSGGSAWLARLVELIRTARTTGLVVAVSAGRAAALPPEVRAARTDLLALPGAEAEPDLGLERPPPGDQPAGRGRLVTSQAHLLGGGSNPAEGPLVQVRWVPPPVPHPAGPEGGHGDAIAPHAPLLRPHPHRVRLDERVSGSPGGAAEAMASGHGDGRPTEPIEGVGPGAAIGIDLERDTVVSAPAHGPFWVLGRARSGRSTALEALAQALGPSEGVRILVATHPEPGGLGGGDNMAASRPTGRWDHVIAPRDLRPGSFAGSADNEVVMVAVDDAHRFDDDGWSALGRWLSERSGHQGGPLVALAADPASLDRWNPEVTALLGHGAGLMLAPEPDEDGRLLGADLPRHRPFAMGAGRGFLVARATTPRPIQVAWPHS